MVVLRSKTEERNAEGHMATTHQVDESTRVLLDQLIRAPAEIDDERHGEHDVSNHGSDVGFRVLSTSYT